MTTHAPVELKKASYGVAIQYDCFDGKGVDLDLQAVIVDERGLIVDAVYYNNVSALDGAMFLSGDSTTGAAEGLDESMWIALARLPSAIKMIIFVVAVYGKGRLRNVDNGMISVLEEGRPIKTFEVEKSGGDADVVAMMRRNSRGVWELLQVEAPADYGSHFLDILEPNIGDLIRKEISCAPNYIQVSFEMEKGALVPLPQTSELKRVFVGVGGTLPLQSNQDVDIDISAVFFDTKGKCMGAVDCDCNERYGVAHLGDRVAGDEETRRGADDEAISINLAQVPKKVRCIFLVLSTAVGHFGLVKSAYTRIIDQSATELMRYDVQKSTTATTGLIIAKLLRHKGRRWGFMAVGHHLTTECRTWKSAQAEMERLFHKSKEHHCQHHDSEEHEVDEKDPEAAPAQAEVGVGSGDAAAGGKADATQAQTTEPIGTTADGETTQPSPRRTQRRISFRMVGRLSTLGVSRCATSRCSVLPASLSSTAALASKEDVMLRQASPDFAVSSPATVKIEASAGLPQSTETLEFGQTMKVVKRGTIRLSVSKSSDLDADVQLVDDRESSEPTSRRCVPCGSCRSPAFLGFCSGDSNFAKV